MKGEELSGLQLQHFGFVPVDQISSNSIFSFAFLTYTLKMITETALLLLLYRLQQQLNSPVLGLLPLQAALLSP